MEIKRRKFNGNKKNIQLTLFFSFCNKLGDLAA